jgi:hypothetical protein
MRWISRFMIVLMASMSMPISANAAMVDTGQVVDHALVEQGRAKIMAIVEREDFRTQLEANGVTAERAIARVNAMTDEEVIQVSGKIDQLPAGGDIIEALVFIFVVLLITDILGLTKVFKFTRSITR